MLQFIAFVPCTTYYRRCWSKGPDSNEVLPKCLRCPCSKNDVRLQMVHMTRWSKHHKSRITWEKSKAPVIFFSLEVRSRIGRRLNGFCRWSSSIAPGHGPLLCPWLWVSGLQRESPWGAPVAKSLYICIYIYHMYYTIIYIICINSIIHHITKYIVDILYCIYVYIYIYFMYIIMYYWSGYRLPRFFFQALPGCCRSIATSHGGSVVGTPRSIWDSHGLPWFRKYIRERQ